MIENEIKALKDKICCYEEQVADMRAHIDCLKAELKEVQTKKVDFPTEPIRVADMLIEEFSKARVDYVDSATSNGYPCDSKTVDIMSKQEISLLRQIAEHLLVYCNNVEVH